MSKKETMLQFLNIMLDPNNKMRKNVEENIEVFSQQNVNEFTQINLEIIKNEKIPTNIRMSSLYVLKSKLIVGKNKPSLYLKLSLETLLQFQKEIILALNEITNLFLVKNVANFIAELAGALLNVKENILDENQKWPNLIQHIFELYSTKNEKSMIASLYVLEGMFDSSGTKLTIFKDQFLLLFKDGFLHQNLEIRICTLLCLLGLVEASRVKDIKDFKVMTETVLHTILDVINFNDAHALKRIIYKVFEVCQKSPCFFKSKFHEFLIVMSRVRDFEKEVNSSLKSQSLESIIFLLDTYPELVENEKEKLQVIIELIFKNMIEIEDEIPEDWANPRDGFNDDLANEDDQINIKLAIDFIDRLIIIVSEEIMLPILSGYIKKMLSEENWKIKHAALWTISQIGEYLEDNLNEVENLMKIINNNSSSTNPRLRYACCHILGQFSDDLHPDFQDNFHELFFSICLPFLEDKVPRVVAHALAALTNFLEHCNDHHIQAHFDYIYNKIVFWIENGSVFVKEAALNVLSALAEGAGDLFSPFYDQSMNILLSMLKMEKKDTFKKIKGNAIESLTIIGKLYGKTKFLPYSKYIIPEMIKIQKSEISYDNDPQKSYLISGWSRICKTVEEELIPYMNDLMPSLILLCKNSIDQNCLEIEEIDSCLELMNLFMKHYPKYLWNYIEPIYDIIISLVDCDIKKDTKTNALACLPHLIHLTKINCSETNIFAKNIFIQLWKFFDEEEDPVYKSEYCFILQKLVSEVGAIFDQNELNELLKNCEEEIRKSDIRKKKLPENYDKEEETEEKINYYMNYENQFEDDLKLEIAVLLGKIFEFHKEIALDIFSRIYYNHCLPCFQSQNESVNIQYALYLLSKGIHYLGNFLSETIIKNCFDIFLNYSSNENLKIRKISHFALNKIFNLLKPQDLEKNLDNTIQVIGQSVKIEKLENQKKDDFVRCRESALTAFSKLLKKNWNFLEKNKKSSYIIFWTNYLPIIFSKKLALKNHKIILEIIVNDPHVILGNKNENFKNIFNILYKIYMSKQISTPKIDHLIEKVIIEFVKDRSLQNFISEISLRKEKEIFIQNILKKYNN